MERGVLYRLPDCNLTLSQALLNLHHECSLPAILPAIEVRHGVTGPILNDHRQAEVHPALLAAADGQGARLYDTSGPLCSLDVPGQYPGRQLTP